MNSDTKIQSDLPTECYHYNCIVKTQTLQTHSNSCSHCIGQDTDYRCSIVHCFWSFHKMWFLIWKLLMTNSRASKGGDGDWLYHFLIILYLFLLRCRMLYLSCHYLLMGWSSILLQFGHTNKIHLLQSSFLHQHLRIERSMSILHKPCRSRPCTLMSCLNQRDHKSHSLTCHLPTLSLCMMYMA